MVNTPDEQSAVVYEVPSFLRRGIVYLLALLMLVAAGVLAFGQVSVVVNGRGRIVPEGDVILVQALQRGVVKAVLARAGDRLPAGAPLLNLDISDAGVALTELKQRSTVQHEQLQRIRATIAFVDRVIADPKGAVQASPQQGVETVGEVMHLVNELENMQAKADAAEGAARNWPARRGGMVRDIGLTRDNVRVNEDSHASQAKLLQSTEAALVQKRAQLDSYRGLAERRLLSSLELGVEEEKFRAAEGAAAEARRRYEQLAIDISNQKIKLQDLEARLEGEPAARQAAARQAQNTMRQTLALLREERANLDSQARELEGALLGTQARLALAESQASLASVTTPVPGIVAEMKVTSTGEVLELGRLVATIVPEGVPLVVEAEVPNRDVAFVRPGIEGRIKVDAYPFHQFGTLAARVQTVLPALGTGNSFTVKLQLLDTSIGTRGEALPLFPGLAVQAELLTARRRLLDLLLDSRGASPTRPPDRP
ncbi:MAG: HlyD family efflux transporter periplasmic adaptor subunit [Acidobacteriota bacterium]|nr:HlyD family efflux transporter periplasmic adaptor subunit [Acidobacteriota bacterium]